MLNEKKILIVSRSGHYFDKGRINFKNWKLLKKLILWICRRSLSEFIASNKICKNLKDLKYFSILEWSLVDCNCSTRNFWESIWYILIWNHDIYWMSSWYRFVKQLRLKETSQLNFLLEELSFSRPHTTKIWLEISGLPVNSKDEKNVNVLKKYWHLYGWSCFSWKYKI